MSEHNPSVSTGGMPIAQQAALVTGASFWETVPVPGHGLASITVSDGPHGLRHQSAGSDHLGGLRADPATCFPPAVTLACSWDPALARRVGAAIGKEAKAAGVGVVLGPGINITRSVRCGRNFEYFSEDPMIAAQLGAAWVAGLQGEGVGASLKHFAVNNQETDRLRISAQVGTRALREIYLRAFEHIVRTQQPWTVMCSYNAINGTFAAQNHWLLTETLRDRWGFEGLVISDWGAVQDRVESLRAGLDLQMPGPDARATRHVEDAVKSGALPADMLRDCAERIVALVGRATASQDLTATYDADVHHRLAAEVAESSVVLLRNNGILPLVDTGGDIAVVGELARTPRYQGAGSSQIVPTRLDNVLDSLRREAPDRNIRFAPGYRLDGVTDESLVDAALTIAAAATDVLVFLGLPDDAESEGFDRPDIELPTTQVVLLDRLLQQGIAPVVVLANGSVVRVSGWVDRVPALLEGWLAGQAGGAAVARVLLGRYDPGGRLAQTIPVRLQDTPDYLDFPGEEREIHYGEGVFVGYRWYDARHIEVAYPFGHGLSYTTFDYSSPTIAVDGGSLCVDLTVTNTGDRDGVEVVQVYVGLPASAVRRAQRELRGFAKVKIAAGESRSVRLDIPVRDLAYFSAAGDRWQLETGDYEVSVGASSRDLRWIGSVHIEGDDPVFPITLDSSVQEWLCDPTVGDRIRSMMTGTMFDPEGSMAVLLGQNPIRSFADFAPDIVNRDQLESLAAEAWAAL